MDRPDHLPANASIITGSAPRIAIKRIRFLERSISGEKIRRQFKHPRSILAVEETAGLSELPTETPESDPIDHLVAVCMHPDSESEWRMIGDGWLTPRDDADAAQVVSVQGPGTAISWLPGRAIISTRSEGREDALAALTEFAFYEAELRRLEQALEEKEGFAEADVAPAHRIRFRDRRHWDQFGEFAEQCARMRLTFARLQPRLAKTSRSLRPNARRLVAQLMRAADVKARARSFDRRLKACENLYESAHDRVMRFRWHLTGWLLESAIVAVLVLGIVLMAAGLCTR
jgi:hypothetical protein